MSKRYRVELVAFPGLSRERAVAHLAEAFDLDLEEALIYIDALPCIVRTDVDGEVAKEYTRELLRAGADVAIVDEVSGHRVLHQSGKLKETIQHALLPPEAVTGSHPAAASPPPQPAVVTSAAEPAPPPAEEVEPRIDNVYCPRCGLRQPMVGKCSQCGYAFDAQKKAAGAPPSGAIPAVSSEAGTGEAATGEADVDVFQSLRGKAGTAKVVRPLRVPTRRTRDFSLELPAARRRRSYLWVLLFLAAALVVVLLLMQPDEGMGPEDALPEDAIPPPPGLRYRRL